MLYDTAGSGTGYNGPIQWINPLCLREGKEYEIQARFKLYRDGQMVVCDPNQGHATHVDRCPILTAYVYTPTWSGAYHLATKAEPQGSCGDDWGTVHNTFPVVPNMLDAYSMYVYLEFVPPGTDVVVDNFSMKPFEKTCSNLISNGDFETEGMNFWGSENGGLMEVVCGGYGESSKSLMLKGRDRRESLLMQSLDRTCIEGDINYVVEAKVKMFKNDDGSAVYACDPNVIGTGHNECPYADIRTDNTEARGRIVGAVVGALDDGWYLIRGTFEFYGYDLAETASRLELRFFRAPAGVDLVVDDVKIVKASDYVYS